MHPPDISRLVRRARRFFKLAPSNSKSVPKKTRCTHGFTTYQYDGSPRMQHSPVATSQSAAPAQEAHTSCTPMESAQFTTNAPTGGWHRHIRENYGPSLRPQIKVERWMNDTECQKNMAPTQRSFTQEEHISAQAAAAHLQENPPRPESAPVEHNNEGTYHIVQIERYDNPEGVLIVADTLREVTEEGIDTRRLLDIREQIRRQRRAKGRL